MKKFILIVLLILISLNFSIAQTPKAAPTAQCKIKYNDLPLIRGVRLGMSQKQVLAVYPKLVLKKSDLALFNESITGLLKRDSIDSAEYRKNIETISFSFYDDNLSTATFQYDDSITWLSTKEFTGRIAESLKLPFEMWREGDSTKDGYINSYFLHCDGFSFIASMSKGNQPYLTLTRSVEAFLEGNEKKIKEFKP